MLYRYAQTSESCVYVEEIVDVLFTVLLFFSGYSDQAFI